MNPPDRPSPDRPLRSALILSGRFLLGLAIGVFLHYLLFRVTLPVQPFIYVAF